jgi:diketogulonate reductase-like aldo/keto reductase
MKNNQPIIETLTRFGAKKGGATPAQIALAWLMARKPWIVPIPGTTKVDRLRENMGALNVQLTPADLREIETAFSRIEIYGGRMDAKQRVGAPPRSSTPAPSRTTPCSSTRAATSTTTLATSLSIGY